MKRFAVAFTACLGVATIIYLLTEVGFGAVFAAVTSLRWWGFAVVCFLGVVLFAALSAAWFVLLPSGRAKAWPTFFWGRAVRDSAGEVLPLSQFGGFVIGARAISLRGVSAANAYGSTVVDITTEFVAQIVYVALGCVLFAVHLGIYSTHSGLLVPLVAAPVLAALGAFSFILVQQRGPQFAESLAARLLPRAIAGAGAFARAISAIYAEPLRVVASIAIHFGCWMLSAFASWVAVRLIGGHISYPSMVAIESALAAIRSAAVFVPSAVGVQEATYAMLMPLFGAAPEIGLALSLIKRARDVALGVPVLLSWQGFESRQMLALPARDKRLLER